MLINSISIRNFKSYGNNLQKLSFSDTGELILMMGGNGMGKSAFLESIDFSLFNIVRGKNTKRVPNYVLPNRKNKNLEVEIDFINWKNENVVINRKMSPKSMSVKINNIDITTRYNNMDSKEKEEIIGIEYDTYRSLISLNLADFANFINLETETKKRLLNKIFNIDEIDEYLSISKEMLKNAYRQKERLDILINSNNNTIETYKNNIISILEKTNEIIDKESIKDEILKCKNKSTTLKSEIGELKQLLYPMQSEIKKSINLFNVQKDKIYKEDLQISELNHKIEIFKTGECPFCSTKLIDNKHKVELDKLINNYEELSSNTLLLKKIHRELKNEIREKSNQKSIISNDIFLKETEYEELKNNFTHLKNEYNRDSDTNVSINEIEKNIEIVRDQNYQYEEELFGASLKIEKFEKINEILSERGIRKSIINNIVVPINKHLSEYLIKLESIYNVKLDDQFDAVIKERYMDDIHVESLSTGEARKINIAIALSYMEMILSMNKKINILFMDEVFASVDPENIDAILNILRTFSKNNNITIIIVNHSSFDMKKFDRVIRIEKELGFSQIKELVV